MSEKLKPCPFCGASGEINSWRDCTHMVICEECGGATAMADTQETAISAWNRRAPSPSPDVTGRPFYPRTVPLKDGE